jgi:hypothetical protein
MAKDPSTIGYCDFETTNPNDILNQGFSLKVVGNGIFLVDKNGVVLDMIPEVTAKLGCIVAKNYDSGEEFTPYHTTDMLDYLRKMYQMDRCYFHNLAFDISFITSLFFSGNGRIDIDNNLSIVDMDFMVGRQGATYKVTIAYEYNTHVYDKRAHRTRVYKKKVEVWDSAKIWAGKLDKLANDFGMKKGDKEGVSQALAVGVTDKMIEYCIQDCQILKTIMEYYFEQVSEYTRGKVKFGYMTAASTAMNCYKEHMGTKLSEKAYKAFFPTGPDSGVSSWIRGAYKGATPLLNPKIRGKLLKKVSVFDVNSMHPTQMFYRRMPVGKGMIISPEYLEECDYVLPDNMVWVAKARISAVAKPEVGRGTFLTKNTREYGTTLPVVLKPEIVEVVTDSDLRLLERNYDIDYLEVTDVIAFHTKKGMFSDFIGYWYRMKAQAGVDGNKSLKAFCKLIINSFYGKWGTNPDRIEMEPYMNDDGCLRLKDITPDRSAEELENPYYLPIAMWTTAYSREYLNDACWAIGWDNVVYTDTDSIHCINLTRDEIEERLHEVGLGTDPDKLGDFAYESTSEYAVYIRNKGYFHFNELDEKGRVKNMVVKMAGVNTWDWKSMDDVVENGRFKEGISGKNIEAFNVKGGRLLFEVEKKITCNDRDGLVSVISDATGMRQEIYSGGKLMWKRGECGTG